MPRCPRRLLQAGFSLIVLLALAGPAVVMPAPALAATVTWTGTDGACPGGSPWSTAACWNNGAGPVPSNGDAVVFAQTGNNRPNNCDLSRTLNSITFSNTGVPSNLVNVGGCPLGLQSGGFITDNNNPNAIETINTGRSLNGPATFTLSNGANNGLSFGGSAITGTGPLTLTNNSADDRLRLTVADAYSGATAVTGTGRVRFDVNGAVPTGSALTVNGSALFQAASTIGSLAGGGNVFMNGNNTLSAGGDNTSSTVSGIYQNSGGSAALTKTGSGTLTLSGNNTYSGTTTLSAGTLLVNGSQSGSPVSVSPGATLGGTGTTAAITTSGTVSPGVSGPGLLSSGAVTFNAGSALSVDLNGATVGSGYDRLNVAGTVDLSGSPSLNVSLGFASTAGNTFTIVQGTGALTGRFAGLPDGSMSH